MGVGTFVQPDADTQEGTDYKNYLEACFAVLKRQAAAFAPHEQTVPNMTVRVDAGAIFSNDDNSLTEVAAQNTGTITAPTTNPRIDRIVIAQLNGVVSVITGTPAGSPVPPAIITGKLPVAQVLLQTSTTIITNDMIIDERQLNLAGITFPEPDVSAGFQSVQVFTAGGTWTKPSGITKIVVEVIGGGAGGRSGTYETTVGGGGGAGGYSLKVIDVSAIASESVTIGAGGAANNAGGTSSFGSHCSATGGLQPSAAGTISQRNGGGAGSGGDINLPGEWGGNGFVFDMSMGTASGGIGGNGGSTKYGAGGRGGCSDMTSSDYGCDGDGYGPGGGGGVGDTYGWGGAGKGGIVIVWEYK